MLKRIRVTYTGLDVVDDDSEKVQRVLRVHQDACPVARSLKGAIEITTELG